LFIKELISSIEHLENRIRRLLKQNTNNDITELTSCFESCLMAFFRSLPKEEEFSYWAIDDFTLELEQKDDETRTLCGTCFWLVGGKSCSQVKIDIHVSTKYLLYSYKFYPKYWNLKQTLYIAKTKKGWFLNKST